MAASDLRHLYYYANATLLRWMSLFLLAFASSVQFHGLRFRRLKLANRKKAFGEGESLCLRMRIKAICKRTHGHHPSSESFYYWLQIIHRLKNNVHALYAWVCLCVSVCVSVFVCVCGGFSRQNKKSAKQQQQPQQPQQVEDDEEEEESEQRRQSTETRIRYKIHFLSWRAFFAWNSFAVLFKDGEIWNPSKAINVIVKKTQR